MRPRSFAAFAAAALMPSLAAAQEAAPASETSVFLFNTLLLLICGVIVMFMTAGFCLLEAGLVRSKNVAAICLKNIAAYAVASMMIWLTGYNLIYGVEAGGFLGRFALWSASDLDPVGRGFASSADFFFQMVFVATAASIVSGAIAERVKLFSFLIFIAALTGLHRAASFALLDAAGGRVATAALMHLRGLDRSGAEALLERASGRLAAAL